MGKKYRVGIDVGGTNTDAVILEFNAHLNSDRGVVAWHKAATTLDVTDGIATALQEVLQKSQISKEDILYLSIGTTHFLNAVIEADSSRLSKVAVLRLAGPYTARCPPFVDFPPRLRNILMGHWSILDGGLEINGNEIMPINTEQIRKECEILRSKGIDTIVIAGVFSPLAPSGTQEEYAKKIIKDILGADKVNIVCSKDVGHVGFLERENASILNAAILSFARKTVRAYKAVLKRLDLRCPLYLTQLDGTLIAASVAAAVPIRTFSNGPTNSMRGASYLAGLDPRLQQKSTIVIDVGGTTTDVGVLLPSGFPRTAAAFTEVGGVRTSFSMPDIHSIGLGGGSRVRFTSSGATVGPDSVGHNIEHEAIIFGGSTLTASDLAVFSGLADMGLKTRIAGVISEKEQEYGVATIKRMLEIAIDKMKTDPGDVTVLLVGGGSVIVPEKLNGVGEMLRPPFFSVANAVGAAIARISGGVDKIEIPEGRSMDQIIESCKEEAVKKAIEMGAKPNTVTIAEVTAIQLPYVANHASRIIIKAVGDLDIDAIGRIGTDFDSEADLPEYQPEYREKATMMAPVADEIEDDVDIFNYGPNISPEGVWSVSETDLEWLAEGCAVLGCGGGGSPYASFLHGREILRNGGRIRIVDQSYFEGKDGWVQPCGFMGSPSVSSERIPSGQEVPTALANLAKFLGTTGFTACISDEIGGKNGLEPMLLASRPEVDLPVIDGDLMGRAYPRLDQITPCISKPDGLFPVAAADGLGNCIVVPRANNNAVVEDILRAACTVLGSSVALAIAPLRLEDLAEYAILGSTSHAWRIGRAIAMCRKANKIADVPKEILKLQDGKCLFVGKIVSCKREVRGGFTHGQITIAPLLQEEMERPSIENDLKSTDLLHIPFQNENLQAVLECADGTQKTLCSVPDLIAVLDSQNGASIGTQDYRYGLRVTVVGMSCDPIWTSALGLKLGGPDAFRLNTSYTPIGTYKRPRSVIEEYR